MIGGNRTADKLFLLFDVVGIAFLVNYRLSKKMLAKEIEAEEKRVISQQP